MKKLRKSIIHLILLGLLSMAIITPQFNLNRHFNNDFKHFNNDLISSKVSGKIYINGNQGWIDFRNAGNCTGEGIRSDPYIIEDLIIDGDGSGKSIHIQDSDVYFVIRNCTIYNSSAGIFFDNVENGQLVNNNCSFNNRGISLLRSSYNNISRNILNYNTQYGIYLYTFSNLENNRHNKIIENTISYNHDYGIYLSSHNFECKRITILGNTITNNKNHGIYLSYDLKYINILNNDINNNTGNGIMFDYGIGSSSIINNTISNNTMNGIYSFASYVNTISKNNITNNIQNGIYLERLGYNSISKNNISYNGQGGNYDGIFFKGEEQYSSIYQNATENVISHNTRHGIHYENYCRRSTLSNNIINKNNYSGIFFTNNCTNNTISENKITSNSQYGAIINDLGTQTNLFFDNNFSENIIGNALDNGLNNNWNNTDIGNYWDDYGGVDLNDDGIGDTPYNISGDAGSKDYFPIWNDGDDLPPIIRINSPSMYDAFGFNAPTFDITINDASPIDTTWYTIDGGITNYTFSGLTGTVNQTEWDKKGNGTVTIRFYANDSWGFEAFNDVKIRKDTLAPNSSIWFTPHSGINIVNESTVFSLNADDGSGSGVSLIRYKINESNWITYSSPFTLSNYPYGDILISYQAIDQVDNYEAIQTLLLHLTDTITPISSISFTPYSGMNEVIESTTFTLSADDGIGSGVAVIRYKINNSGWIDYTGSFNLSGYVYGDYLITYQAIDVVGNIEDENSIIVKLVAETSEPRIPGYNILILITVITLITAYKMRKKLKTNASH